MLATYIFAALLVTCSAQTLKDEAPCDSPIYCNGPLLEAAQNARIYNDSKTFVDLHMRQPEDIILAAFGNISDPDNATIMAEFVEEYFDGPNIEFTTWEPSDWTENPSFLEGIKDEELRLWAEELNELWKELGRQINVDVSDNADRYSLQYVEDPFVVPGGRFREFYYWDSYWIFKGLLLSEMTETVKGMLSNFVSMVKSIGHVPNGNRVYYQKRSQPPFLIPSVYLYYQATEDVDTVRKFMADLEEEYRFWMDERSINITSGSEVYTLNRYNVFMGMPRPESYREDIETAEGLDEDAAAEVYSNLASAAESGWDFSTRWFGEEQTLSSIRTKEVVPVDLNSVLCHSEWALAEMLDVIDESEKAEEYRQAFNDRKEALNALMWSETRGVWLDYDLDTDTLIDKFYPSNIMPLWANCVDKTEEIEQNVLHYLQDEDVLSYPGGIPTSLVRSGQQWDYPNAWPPLQDIVIETLGNSQLTEANELAFSLALNWTRTNWRAYNLTGLMFEKYDVENQGIPGHGGEYAVQAGFGWTNGVMMVLLDRYGEDLTVDDTGAGHQVTAQILLCLLFSFIVWLTCLR